MQFIDSELWLTIPQFWVHNTWPCWRSFHHYGWPLWKNFYCRGWRQCKTGWKFWKIFCAFCFKNNLSILLPGVSGIHILTIQKKKSPTSSCSIDLFQDLPKTYFLAEFRYRGVAVIRKDSSIKDINSLKGLKSCHTGIGRMVGYKVPLTKVSFFLSQIGRQD